METTVQRKTLNDLAPGQSGTIPVSYTHLEVYKRQSMAWPMATTT